MQTSEAVIHLSRQHYPRSAAFFPPRGGGGGGNPLYKPYRNVPSQSVWFLGLFLCVKTGIHITHFGLESGMVFEGTTGAYEHIYRFNSKLIRKTEICEFEMHLKKCLLAL